MAAKGGFKCKCANCGWTTRRHLKNMSRPCPKCGGACSVHEEDKDTALVVVVISLVFMAGFGVLWSMLGAGQ